MSLDVTTIDDFVNMLIKQGVTVKGDDLFINRKKLTGTSEAETYLTILKKDKRMSYDLVDKAKERLRELNDQKNERRLVKRESSIIPEIYYSVTPGGSIAYWVKPNLDLEVYSRLDYQLSQEILLINAIIQKIPQYRKDRLQEIAETTIDDRNKRMSIETLVKLTLQEDRLHSRNILTEYPKPFTTNPNTPACVYFDLSRIPQVPNDTPTWDILTKRLEIEGTTLNAQEFFKAFVWSIFEENDTNRVFLYWYGAGSDGKSQALEVIEEFLGSDLVASNKFDSSDKHNTSGLVNKRLILQVESNAVKLTKEPTVKQITGRDLIEINPKNKEPYSIRLEAKIIAIGNETPKVGSQLSELSRLLPIYISPLKYEDEVVNYEIKLREEIRDFLSKCRISYNTLKNESTKSTFLSRPKEIAGSSAFKDYAGLLCEILESDYELVNSSFGTRSKNIVKIIDKIISENPEFKNYVKPTTPRVLDFLETWASKHGGVFNKTGAKRDIRNLLLQKKDSTKVPVESSDIGI